MTRAIHANERDTDHRRDQHEARRPRGVAALDLVQRILQHQRAAVRVADEHERLVGADPLPHVANTDTNGGEPVFPDGGDEAGRHGAVPRHPQRQTVVAARLQRLPDRAHAVGRVGEAVNQKGAADDLAGGHDLVGAVAVRTEARGMRSAAAVVAVGRRRRRPGGRALDPIAHVPKDGVFPPQVLGEGGCLEIRRCRIRRHVAVPRFQIRQAPPRVHGAADDHGGEDQHRGPDGPDEPAFHGLLPARLFAASLFPVRRAAQDPAERVVVRRNDAVSVGVDSATECTTGYRMRRSWSCSLNEHERA